MSYITFILILLSLTLILSSVFIIITILLLSLLSLSLKLQLPSISSTKYFELLSLLGTTMKIKLFCQFCAIRAIFIFSPYIKKMMLFIFCIKCSFYDLFIYLFIYFSRYFLTENLQFCNFFFCGTFVYFSING